MALDDASVEELRDSLQDVESKAATQRLMVAIAHKQGVTESELADWFGLDADALDEWFAEFETRSVAAVVDEIERFELPGRGTKPVLHQPGSARVSFLNYEVLQDHGWGLDDADLFEKAATEDLSDEDYGRIAVQRGESILEAAERRGYEWPYACRGGACSNCAVILVEGEIAMPGQQILPESAVERGARLTCVGIPATTNVKIVYNAKDADYLEELRLPADRFTSA